MTAAHVNIAVNMDRAWKQRKIFHKSPAVRKTVGEITRRAESEFSVLTTNVPRSCSNNTLHNVRGEPASPFSSSFSSFSSALPLLGFVRPFHSLDRRWINSRFARCNCPITKATSSRAPEKKVVLFGESALIPAVIDMVRRAIDSAGLSRPSRASPYIRT